MKEMTDDLRKKIQMYIKNRKDISELTYDVNISNEKLEYAIIKNFNRNNQTIYRVNLAHSILGEEGKLTTFCNNKLIDCRFDDVRFKGKWFFRHNKVFNCNFSSSWMPYFEAQFTEFDDNCNFCETFMRLGVSYLWKTKFGINLFQDLLRFTNLKVIEKKENE